MVGDVEQAARNVVLEGLLARVQWTPEQLAERLNALAAMLGLDVEVNPRTPQRWVNGRAGRPAPPVPREPWPGLVCLLLHRQSGQPVTPEMLGWPASRGLRHVPAGGGLGRTHDGVGAIAALGEVVDADIPEQDYVMALNEPSPSETAHQWVYDPARVMAAARGKHVDHEVVDTIDRLVQSQRRLAGALSGLALPPVRESLRLVVALLGSSTYCEEVGRRLYALAVALGRLAGWVAFESDQPELAQRYLLAALRAAHAGGDYPAGVDILGVLSVLAEPPAARPG
ncbi:MAG: hypothetical protein ACRDTC_03225 [Pseudonocardiaceae bacterium]